ncbi:MAG: hypothetical protein ABUT39_06155 [Acidobacteriota bacterium]
MSWDVLILHPDSAAPPPDGAPCLHPLGLAEDVRRAVSRALPGIEWDAPVQGSYRGVAVSVDVELPSQGVVDSFALHLRGLGNPMPVIVRICRQNGWVAFDSAAGAFLDLKEPSAEGWENGVLFRAQMQALAQLHRDREREAGSSGRSGHRRRRAVRRRLLWLVPLLLSLVALAGLTWWALS